MIGFFTDPYPDELLFSACSRYHERSGYRTREATSRDLFGMRCAKVAIDLPCNLGALEAALPSDYEYTVDEFIEDHTMLPLFAPFVPPARVRQLREDMRGAGGSKVHWNIGILTSSIDVEFLRFCPACVKADREEFGETFWHRLQQAPGVWVCPIHKVFLENSTVHTRTREAGEAFVTAEESVHTVPERHIDLSDTRHLTYLRIAEDAAWLLSRRNLEAETDANRQRYFGLLFEKGFSTYFCNVKITALTAALGEYYTPEFLEHLRCGLKGKHHWLRRLLNNRGRAQHPLPNLLLMQFLGCPASEFFDLTAERRPFGEGPWPCLNRASDHFGQDLILEYELVPTQRNQRRPRGTFRCECGFAYYRIGPDTSEECRYMKSGFVEFGKVWEEALAKLCKEKSCTRKQMAEKLGVSVMTINCKIARMKASSSKAEGVAGKRAASGRVKSQETVIDQTLLEERRRLYISAREAEPEAVRSKLRAKLPTVFDWLYKHDKEWFEANSPERKWPQGPGGYVNWSERDAELEKAVRDEAERLMNAPGRPVWVSETGVARRIGKLTTIWKHRDKLTLTVKALKEVAESKEDYALRRVWWATNYYLDKGMYVNYWHLTRQAGLSPGMAKNAKIKSAIEEALASLDPLRQNLQKVRNYNVQEIRGVAAAAG